MLMGTPVLSGFLLICPSFRTATSTYIVGAGRQDVVRPLQKGERNRRMNGRLLLNRSIYFSSFIIFLFHFCVWRGPLSEWIPTNCALYSSRPVRSTLYSVRRRIPTRLLFQPSSSVMKHVNIHASVPETNDRVSYSLVVGTKERRGMVEHAVANRPTDHGTVMFSRIIKERTERKKGERERKK